jgi:ribonuclease D
MTKKTKAAKDHPLIANSEDLRRFCDALKNADFVTVDTEFMRDSTYWPKLCLIQVAGPEQAAAIDPLVKDLDWAPFFALLEDPAILKVFHSARQDLEIFYHWTGRLPAPLFDTQVAAMVCGFGDSVGYETLARRLAGARIDKSTRFADWSRRPLSAKQREYAMSDVTHLRPIFEKLQARLVKNDRAHWLEEEMAILSNPTTYDLDPDLAWRRLKSNSSDRRYLAVLCGLARWREQEAQRRDVPRNRVLRDEQLYNIATQRPETVESLARCRGFREDLARGRIGAAILETVAEALALPEESLPRAPQRVSRPAARNMELL